MGVKVNGDLLHLALQLPRPNRPSTTGVHNTGRVGQKVSKRIDRMKRCPNTTRLTSFEESDAFVAGGQSEEWSPPQQLVGISPSFRKYLTKWGIFADSYEYYGLTRNGDFENASVLNCVRFTLENDKLAFPKVILSFETTTMKVFLHWRILEGEERELQFGTTL